ncbi:MAG: hypothetical protein SAL70_44070, partial [Scytonema sp. PMC 1070.18]|nr:hypothetical protein [Scytonema sp. PMC 1070.18]
MGLIQIKDANNHVTKHEYDELNRRSVTVKTWFSRILTSLTWISKVIISKGFKVRTQPILVTLLKPGIPPNYELSGEVWASPLSPPLRTVH